MAVEQLLHGCYILKHKETTIKHSTDDLIFFAGCPLSNKINSSDLVVDQSVVCSVFISPSIIDSAFLETQQTT